MRTLATQMRLRRLLRTQADYQRRLAVEREARPLAIAASARLLQLLQDVRDTWDRESRGADLAGIRPYVQRSFATMQASAAGVARPGADVKRLGAELREAGVPLVFFLRGLDDFAAPVLAELAGQGLARSA
ncbi:MAG TPA: hypothetical protein VGO86_03375 [Candidatus Dormibacteraeota bacterium]